MVSFRVDLSTEASYNPCMMKNEMTIELVKIVKNESDANDYDCENQGGSAFIKVNGKTVEVIVHPCGELDFDGDVVEEEEFDAVLNFFNSNEEVEKAFPADEFE